MGQHWFCYLSWVPLPISPEYTLSVCLPNYVPRVHRGVEPGPDVPAAVEEPGRGPDPGDTGQDPQDRRGGDRQVHTGYTRTATNQTH